MTLTDADLHELARFWRAKGAIEATACAAQLEDALAARLAAERARLVLEARIAAQKLIYGRL